MCDSVAILIYLALIPVGAFGWFLLIASAIDLLRKKNESK